MSSDDYATFLSNVVFGRGYRLHEVQRYKGGTQLLAIARRGPVNGACP